MLKSKIMKFKSIIIFILLAFLSHQISYGQEKDKICLCKPLKETKENDAKVIEMAEYIENSFHELETKGFNEKFHVKSFINNITDSQDIDLEDQYTIGFMKGIEDTGKTLSQKIVNSIDAGEYYNLINYHYSIEDMTYYFTFRMFSEASGVNYHDYKVCSDGEDIKFNDIYVYLTGEEISLTFQRLFLLSKPSNKILSKVFGFNSGEDLYTLVEAKKLAEKGDYKGAYEKISEIKGAFGKEKFTLILRASYASSFNDKLYEKVLAEFAELYPKDPTLYLKLVDYYLLKGKYNLALVNVDKLIFETNDDFLNLIKGNIYLLKEEFKNAEKNFEYMTVNYPDLLEGYVGHMVSLNYQNRFEDTLSIVKNLLEQGYDKEALLEFIEEKDIEGHNALEAFVNSKVYQEWKRNS